MGRVLDAVGAGCLLVAVWYALLWVGSPRRPLSVSGRPGPIEPAVVRIHRSGDAAAVMGFGLVLVGCAVVIAWGCEGGGS